MSTFIFYLDFMGHVIGGFTADLFSASAFLPADIISQRLQIQRKINFTSSQFRFVSSADVIRQIWTHEGITGFYRGLGPYVFVYGTASSIWWSSYEFFKHNIFDGLSSLENYFISKTNRNTTNPNVDVNNSTFFKLPLSQLLAGLGAGALSLSVTNPLDVARTRLQLLESRTPQDAKLLKLGYVNLLKMAFKNEGIRGLYKGFTPRLFIRLPGSSLKFVGYEALKRLSSTTSNDCSED